MISDTISHLILTIINLDMKFNLIHSKMFDLEKEKTYRIYTIVTKRYAVFYTS